MAATAVFSPPLARTPLFFGYRSSISTQIAAQPCSFPLALRSCARTCWLHWLPSPCGARGITAPYASQGTRQSCSGCCIASSWGPLRGYPQIVPWHAEKGIGERKERETFTSRYMVAAWRRLHFRIGYIRPLQSGSDSSLNIMTKKKFGISDVWVWEIRVTEELNLSPKNFESVFLLPVYQPLCQLVLLDLNPKQFLKYFPGQSE